VANKPYCRGLVVGKFSPFHKGHEYLIQTANEECEELIIISYSRPEFPSCSSAIRRSWLDNFAPNASVLCVDAPTIEQWRKDDLWQMEMPFNLDNDDLHREFIFKLLNERLKLDIDAVFTSESYGEGFAKYLSHNKKGFGQHVEHVCVDIDRIKIPVSGTDIRNSTTPSDTQIRPYVLADYLPQKVCFLGAESTGKSTISSVLAQEYNEPLVEEYGRTLWERNNGVLTPEDLVDICKVQTENEVKSQLSAERYIFCDTSPLTTLCYSESLFSTMPRVLEAFAEQPYQHIFLCEPDFPLVQDGTRKDERFRKWQHDWYIEQLNNRKIPFTQLKGSLEHRILQVKRSLEYASA